MRSTHLFFAAKKGTTMACRLTANSSNDRLAQLRTELVQAVLEGNRKQESKVELNYLKHLISNYGEEEFTPPSEALKSKARSFESMEIKLHHEETMRVKRIERLLADIGRERADDAVSIQAAPTAKK